MAEDKQRSVPELLKQMENFDPDERFMALRDLHQRLVDRVEISSNYHASVSDKAMELLEDKNSDVSTMATKCLQALVNVFPPEEARKVVDRLSSLIVGDEIPKLRRRKSAYRKDKEESKASIDTWAGGLRGLMLSLDAENGRALADQLVGKLLHGLESPPAGREPDDVSFEMVCLDLLQVVLRRFAEQCTSQYDRLVTVTTGLLSHDDMDLRSRANTVLGGVVAFVPEEMFSSLMQKLIAEINASSASSPALFTYIQSIGQISGAAGLRVGKYLDQIVPKLLELCKRDSAAQQGDDMEEEPESTKQLWEVCLQAFEALIERCPQAVDQYVRQLVDIALDLIRYDPRFVAPADAGGDGSGGDAGAEDGGDEWGGGDGWGDDGDDGWGDDDDAGDADDAGDGSDDAWGAEDAVVGDVINQSDDDTSWRVRRAAVNVISAFVRVRSDILRESYGGLMTSLVDRFSERDASVLEEVVFCTRDLLHESVVSKKDIDMDRDAALSVPVIVRARSSYQTMDDKVEEVVTSAHRVFPSAALNVKKAIYSLLRELLIVRHKSGDLGPHLSVLIPDMVEGITHKDSSFKQDALNLLHLTLEFHGAELVAPFLEDLTAAVSKCVSETHNPNCKATGLRVLGVVSRRVQGDQIERVAAGAYESTLAELKVRDADQAVKNAAIATMAVVISHFGEHLDAHVDDVVTIFIDRLSNPITRVPALQALTDCAEADVRLSSVINDASLVKIGAFLRKKKSEQKHAAAVALEALVKHCSDLIANKDETFAALFKEATPFLSDGDLHLSHLLLDFFTTSVAHHAPAADLLAEGELHSQLHALIVSPLLQGAALESMLGLYRQLATSAVENKQSKVTFKSLVEELRASALPESNGTVLRNIARCHAALTQQSGDDEANRTVKECEKAATSKSQPSHLRVLALLTLGEIGRQVDLRSHKKLEPAVFGAFSDPASEVRLAASFALGSITCGALDHYLSRVLVLAEKHPDQRFLLLDALRETILQHQSDLDHELAFREHSGSVLPLLLETAQSADAGPRNMAAECLGRLAVIDSDTLSPELATLCSGDVNQRHVATLALRFAVSADAVPRAMTSAVDEFIKLINDEDLEVRRQALITVGAVTKANVAMLDSHLREVVLPALSKGTIIDESLVEEVDYGAFKETVDHGLAVRTTAFECLETILVEAPHRIKFSDFMEDVKRGLQEKNQDIKVITYRILRHLAEVHPSELLESLDTFSGAITKGIKPLFKLQNNDGQVGQAAKRLLTTVVEVLYIIMDIHGIEMCPKFCKFHRQVKATKALKAIIAEHEQQRKEQGL